MPQAKTRAIEVAEENARAEKGVQEDNAAGIHSNAVNQYRKRKIARSLEIRMAGTPRARGLAEVVSPLQPERANAVQPPSMLPSTCRRASSETFARNSSPILVIFSDKDGAGEIAPIWLRVKCLFAQHSFPKVLRRSLWAGHF